MLPAKSLHFGVVAAGRSSGHVGRHGRWGLQLRVLRGRRLAVARLHGCDDESSATRGKRDLASPEQLDAVRWRDLDGDGRCELLSGEGH